MPQMRFALLWCIVFSMLGCDPTAKTPEIAAPCTAEWFEYVENRLHTGDSEGHGPDLGSQEWRSVVEFKLGIRNSADAPDPDTDQWCRYIHELISRQILITFVLTAGDFAKQSKGTWKKMGQTEARHIQYKSSIKPVQ